MNTPSTPAAGFSGVYDNPTYLEPFNLGGILFRPVELLEHLLITGATGSGKTRALLMPMIEQILRRFGTADAQKAGLFLIDAKGDMSQLAVECAQRAGRGDDVFILGEGGNCWFPLFELFGGDVTRVANFLFEILEDRTSRGMLNRGGSNDSFWEENARRLLRAACTLAKAEHGFSMGGLNGISCAANQILACNGSHIDEDYGGASSSCLHYCESKANKGLAAGKLTQAEFTEFLDYLNCDVQNGNPRTWATIANMARNYLAQFSQPALRKIFTPDSGKQRISPEDIIDRGVILVVTLSPVLYGEASAPFRMAVKKMFCERVLQRFQLTTMHHGSLRQINQDRPVLYVCDEFHTTLTTGQGGEAFFLDRSREFRCMCLLATQGISAILSVLGNPFLCDHLLNNCRTKVFFANDCPQTSEYFERIGGLHDRKVESLSYTPRIAPVRFRLPNHRFVDSAKMRMVSKAISDQREAKFSAAELGRLPDGSAFVVNKGRTLARFTLNPAGYSCPAFANSSATPLKKSSPYRAASDCGRNPSEISPSHFAEEPERGQNG